MSYAVKVRPEKEAVVEEVKDKLSRAKGVVLTEYRGLNVEQLSELRRKLREQGVEYQVLKNTLVKIALKDSPGAEQLDEYLVGPTAIAFGYDDAVTPAKILSEYARTAKALVLKAAIVEGSVVGTEGVQAIATLPSREVLLAKVVGGMQAPISGFVYVLNGPIQKLAMALSQIAKQKESGAA